MSIVNIATSRYTTKAYDKNRKISSELLEQLQTLMRFTPSSTNSQPWHFIIAASDEAKAVIARATSGPYSGNSAKVLNASHVVVLCARTGLEDDYLLHLLEQEERDGRYKNSEAKEAQHRGRSFYVNLHRQQGDTQQWMEKQVYIALGTLLLGAAGLGIDATPIEGFDYALLDEALGLQQRGLKPVVMAALGYRSEDDANAALPKSRLEPAEIFSQM